MWSFTQLASAHILNLRIGKFQEGHKKCINCERAKTLCDDRSRTRLRIRFSKFSQHGRTEDSSHSSPECTTEDWEGPPPGLDHVDTEEYDPNASSNHNDEAGNEPPSVSLPLESQDPPAVTSISALPISPEASSISLPPISAFNGSTGLTPQFLLEQAETPPVYATHQLSHRETSRSPNDSGLFQRASSLCAQPLLNEKEAELFKHFMTTNVYWVCSDLPIAVVAPRLLFFEMSPNIK